jgi:hypothetical protein
MAPSSKLLCPQLLYLGESGTLRAFRDRRLYDYWTKTPLNESNWVDLGHEASMRIFRNETLWNIGNK